MESRGVLLDPEVLIREYNEGKPELADLIRSFRDSSTGSGQLPVEVLRPAFQSHSVWNEDIRIDPIVLDRRTVSDESSQKMRAQFGRHSLDGVPLGRLAPESDALANAVMGKVPALMMPVRKGSSSRRLGEDRPLRRGSFRTPKAKMKSSASSPAPGLAERH
jgi:hypothetical protein